MAIFHIRIYILLYVYIPYIYYYTYISIILSQNVNYNILQKYNYSRYDTRNDTFCKCNKQIRAIRLMIEHSLFSLYFFIFPMILENLIFMWNLKEDEVYSDAYNVIL